VFLGSQLHLIRTGSDLSINETHLFSGGTLALRTSVSDTPKGIHVSGDGVARQEGAADIGAIYNEGGVNTIGRSIILQGDTRFGGRAGRADNLTILRVTQTNTQQSHAFTKVGSGLISFSGTNNWWMGTTNINGGVLRLGPASYTYLPAGNIRLGTFSQPFGNGGILELTDADFTRNLGTGLNEIQWTGSGGFSAFGANRSVTLNGGATLTWGQAGFFNSFPWSNALMLSSRYATAEINFTNPINLTGGFTHDLTIYVARGILTEAIARMSGQISGSRGLLKLGPGLLFLDNAANSYTGRSIIRTGALRGNIPISSNIQLQGGVLGLDGNFFYGLGLAPSEILWGDGHVFPEASGGFAAYGQNRIVRLGNTTDEIAWAAPFFLQDNKELIFGHYTADAAVIWDRALNFGNAMRTIRVERGTSPFGTTVIFNRALNNSTKSGGLRLVGDGRADLNADSSNLNSDLLEISGAELRIATSNVRLGPVGNIALSEGGRFTIGNFSFGSFDSTQIADTTKVTLNTGTLRYEGRTNENLPNHLWNSPSVETIGDVVLETGANEIHLQKNIASTSYTQLDIGILQRATSSRSTLNLTSNTGLFYSYGTTGNVRLSTATTLAGHMLGGIAPWATINGTDWATTDPSNANAIANFTGYTTGNTHWGNYLTNNDVTFGTATLNSLRLTLNTSPTVTLNGALTLSSGGLLSTGEFSNPAWFNYIAGTGTLTTGENRPLYTHVYGNGLFLYGSIRVTGGMDVVKTGPSTLRYASSGTSQIGSLYIHQGTIELNNGSIQTGTTGEVFIGDGAGHDMLVISGGTNRLANRPKVTLRGTPYGRGAEFGASETQATLALTNGAQQTLSELHIIDRGTIDFTNGNPTAPNRLFLDLLTFNSAGAQLFVRGWHEFEDYLLIKKTAFATAPADALAQWLQLRNQIFFDGYSLDYNLLVADYNADYYQISPWGTMTGFPEPSTYGAILGAVSIGLVAWRKKRQAKTALPR